MDIRVILKSLSPEDRQLWSQYRTEMRKLYINAHNATLGVAGWDYTDDAYLDMIDIKLAVLFDRSGKIEASSDVIGKDDAKAIEAGIEAEDDKMKEVQIIQPSVKLLADAWSVGGTK